MQKHALGRMLQKFGLTGLKPENMGTKNILESRQYGIGRIRSVEFQAGRAVQDFQAAKGDLGNVIKNIYRLDEGQSIKAFNDEVMDVISPAIEMAKVMEPGAKIAKQVPFTKSLLKSQSKARGITQIDDVIKWKQMQDEVISLGEQKLKVSQNYKRALVLRETNEISEKEFLDIIKADKKLNKKLYQLGKDVNSLKTRVPDIETLTKSVDRKGLFKLSDYRVSPKLKALLDKVASQGGDPTALKNVILNMRVAIDNMSGRLLQNTMPEDIAKNIKGQLGSYMTTLYEQFEKSGPLMKYEPTAAQIIKAKDLLRADKVRALDLAKNVEPTGAQMNAINDAVESEVNYFLRKESVDEINVQNLKNEAGDVINNPNRAEIENVVVKDKILTQKVLKPWQRELAGVIKDPSYTFLNTASKQAHLNYTLKYMRDLNKMGSQKGPGKFVFDASELTAEQMANPLKFKQVKPTGQITGLSSLEGKWVRSPIYDSMFDTTSNWLNRSGVGTFYKYAILGPKAASQIAKTILSPLTHARNFISAGAFVAANGAFFPTYGDFSMLMPKSLGGEGVLKQAWDLSGKRVLGTMSKADDALYERLLRVGVVDSQVQVGETKRLIRDLIRDPASMERRVFTDIVKNNKSVKAYQNLGTNLKSRLAKFYGKTQDAYIAEDDFWKVVNWNLERNRYSKVLNNLNINQDNWKQTLDSDTTIGNFLRKIVQRREYVEGAVNPSSQFSNFLDEIAGSLTRNQVPNYGYVGRTMRALRQSPFGNFIAFPLEIMRTGNNIFTESIDEIMAGIGKGTLDNPEIPDLVQVGLKRLFSFGATVGGVPYSLVQTFKAKNDVTDDEMNALRRIVPEWSKNSTLIPTGRDENGYLKYIDFSYSNAYDTLIRPFNAVVNSLAAEGANKESLMKALGLGMTDALSEILKPYATESIYTEALIDSTIRRGIGREGKRVWDEADDIGVKMLKGTVHVAKSLSPGSISQFKRIERAARGKPDKKYGEMYELKDELWGLAGMRNIQSNPERSMKYMVTHFGSGLKRADNLFIKDLLRGGRVTPENIIDRYKYSESRRFAVLKEMYQDILAAKELGMPNWKIEDELKKRKGLPRDVIENLLYGQYTPKEPTKFFEDRMMDINIDLNRKEGISSPNPYYKALPFINAMISTNSNLDLLGEYPDFAETPSITPSLVQNMIPANMMPSGAGGGGGGGGPTPDANIVAASAFNRGTGTDQVNRTYRIDLRRGFFIKALGKSL